MSEYLQVPPCIYYRLLRALDAWLMECELVVKKGGSRETTTIRMVGSSEAEVIGTVQALGWLVIESRPPASQSGSGSSGHTRQFPVLHFTKELLTLLKAGLHIHEACVALSRKETNLAHRAVIEQIVADLELGHAFSDALAGVNGIFPEVLCATVRATEKSGDLAEALQRFVVYRSRFETVRRKIQSAAIYPAVLFFIGSAVALFLIAYVVPKFSAVYENSGRPMPSLSSYLLGLGQVMSDHPWLPLSLCAALASMLALLAARQDVRERAMGLVLRLPYFAAHVNVFRLAQFYRSLSLLLHAGIPLADGLSMAAAGLMPAQRAAAEQARIAVAQGLRLSDALQRATLATPIAHSLIGVGEKTGRLADMLEQAAEFHDEAFGSWVEVATRLVEPLMMAFIGLIIGGVVVLMYMPIFDLAGALG